MDNLKTKANIVLITFFLLVACGRPSLADLVDPDPVRLLEAQLMALDLSGQLRPPADLTEQIYNDLAAIRSSYPEFADITYRPHAAPDEIMVGLTQQAAEQFRNGQYHALDELNQLYGIIEIDDHLLSFISVIILKFNQIYNTRLLSDIYEQAEGVRYAEPNYMIGDGSTIDGDPPFYTFILAWGDCPSGCIYREVSHFKVEDGQVTIPDERYVDAIDGDDDNYGLTPEKAFATIQAAIDDANDGDEVVIYPGTYTGAGNRDITFQGKRLTVRSTDPNDPNVVAATIIDGQDIPGHQGLTVGLEGEADSVIDGLSVVDFWLDSSGAAIGCGSGVTIRNCIISGNFAAVHGGGVGGLDFRLVNCTVTGNSASSGGGVAGGRITSCVISGNTARGEGGGVAWPISVSKSTITGNSAEFTGGGIYDVPAFGNGFVEDSIISGNTAEYDGGGVFGCAVPVRGCLITGNTAGRDGGGLSECNEPIVNCTITDNQALGNGGGLHCAYRNAEVTNSILWGNSGADGNEIALGLSWEGEPSELQISYSNVKGGYAQAQLDPNCQIHWGPGNIDVDPCFAPDSGFVCWFKFDEGEGRKVYDSVGEHEGRLRGSPSWVEGFIDGTLRLDGKEDYVRILEPKDLRFNSNGKDFSVFVWMRASKADSEPGVLIDMRDENDDGWVLRYTKKERVMFSLDRIDITSSTAINDTSWHLVGAVIDRDGKGQVYIDGEPDGAAVAIKSEAMKISAARGMTFGRVSFKQALYFKGKIGEVRVHRRVLSGEEIQYAWFYPFSERLLAPDYRLQSAAGRWDPSANNWVIDGSTSPCIDAGNPGCALGDEPADANNVRINMGAYGGTAEASMPPYDWRSIADLSNDWVVDLSDLAVFVDFWLQSGECIPSDLSRNGSVGFGDFSILADEWGW